MLRPSAAPRRGPGLYCRLPSQRAGFPGGAEHEPHSGAGRHQEGRLHPDLRRQARALAGRGTALRGLGDLPPQGLAGGSEPHLRVADQRLVRPDDAALRRRRRDLGGGRQQVRLRRRAPAPTSGTTARSTPGSSSASGTSSRRSTIPTPSTPASKTPRSSARPTAARSGRSSPGLRGHGTGPHWQPGAGGMGLHTILLDPTRPERIYIAISAAGAFRTDDGGATWTADQPRPALPVHPRPDRRGRPLRAPHRACTRRGRTCSSCRSTGT